MFKAITKGMKKLIPGQSNSQDRPAQLMGQNKTTNSNLNNKAKQPNLPDSYWDAGLFK